MFPWQLGTHLCKRESIFNITLINLYLYKLFMANEDHLGPIKNFEIRYNEFLNLL